MAKLLRIFISSPGDVGEERRVARQVVERLSHVFAGRAALELTIWEHEPLMATAGFQEQIPSAAEMDLVLFILWAKMGTPLPRHLQREDGTSFQSGTEFEFEQAWRSHRSHGFPDIAVYKKSAKPVVELDSEEALLERLRQKKMLDTFMERWFRDPDDKSFTAAFHSFDDPARFEELLEVHLRKWIAGKLMEGAEGPASKRESAGARAVLPFPPYRGLASFEFEHAPIFCGRTRAVHEILNAMRRQIARGRAFVMVFGMSGCGKSSLIRAGVLPALCEPGVMEGAGLARRAVLIPGQGLSGVTVSGVAADGASPRDLFDALAAALMTPAALPELAAGGIGAAELARQLREHPEGALGMIKMSLGQAGAAAAGGAGREPRAARLVLFVDQLEEIFTTGSVTPAQRAAFIRALDALARSGVVWVLATLRSEFYSACNDIPALLDLKEGAGQYDLRPPQPAEIAQMIRQPAEMAGLIFEEHPERGRLDDALRDAAVANPQALPLLQFTLNEIHLRLDGGRILTFAALDALGGMEGALGRRAEEEFAALDDEARAALSRVLSALADMDFKGGDKIVRRRAPLEPLAAQPGARRLVEAFVRARLFTTDQGPDGGAVVSVAHEALLTHWDRVADWTRGSREQLETRGRVAAAAALWSAEGRGEDYLLPGGGRGGGTLARAALLLDNHAITLTPGERELIEASRARHARRRRRRIAGRIALSVVGLALIIAALVFHYLYVWEHDSYYSDFVKYWGIPKGYCRLTPEEVRHRSNSLRFVTRGRRGRLLRFEAVNQLGNLTNNNTLGRSITISAKQGNLFKECQWLFHYDSAGRLISEEGQNQFGKVVFILAYAPAPHGSRVARAEYKTPEGYSSSQVPSGASWVEFERDEKGRDIRASYLDSRGNPARTTYGYAGVRWELDKDGLPLKSIYLDKSGKPCVTHYAAQLAVPKRIRFGDQVEIQALGLDGKPGRTFSGYYKRRNEYDAYGNFLREFNLDEKDRLILTRGGYAIVEIKDELKPDGRVKTWSFRDQNERQISDDDGGHFYEYHYSEHDQLIEYFCRDENGRLINDKDGVASSKSEHTWKVSDSEYVMRTWYFDQTGEPCLNVDGAHGYESVRTLTGDYLVRRYYGLDGNLAANKNGFAIERMSRRQDGEFRIETTNFFAPDDTPTTHALGYFAEERHYDSKNNLIGGFYKTRDGASYPFAESANKTSDELRSYDDMGRVTQFTFQNKDDDEIKFVYLEYDLMGNVLKREYASTSRDSRSDDYHTKPNVFRYKYNNLGHAIERSYWTQSGKPAVKDGFHRVEILPDRFGKPLFESYYDATGEPGLPGQRHSIISRQYDRWGHEIEKKFYTAALERGYNYNNVFAEYSTNKHNGELLSQIFLKPDVGGLLVYFENKQKIMVDVNPDGSPSRGTPDDPVVVRRIEFSPGKTDVEKFILDATGNPLLTTAGYHVQKDVTNLGSLGKIETYCGPDHQPVDTIWGYSSALYDYHTTAAEAMQWSHLADWGELSDYAALAPIQSIKITHYENAAGQPTGNFTNLAEQQIEALDADGSAIVIAWFDARGNPVRSTEGAFMMKSGSYYDEERNGTILAYGDATGRPMENFLGVAMQVSVNESPDGAVFVTRYLDSQGRPAPNRQIGTYSTLRYFSPASANRLIKEEYLNADGQPSPARLGYYSIENKHDERGRVVTISYLNADGRPTDGAQGFARKEITPGAQPPNPNRYFRADGRQVATRLKAFLVVPGGRAETIGLRAGDVVRRLDGVKIHDLDDLTPILNDGRRPLLRLEIERAGQPLTFDIKPGRLSVYFDTLSEEAIAASQPGSGSSAGNAGR